MINNQKVIYLLFGLALLSFSCARSTVLLRNKEAREYLTEENLLLPPGNFTFEEIRDRQGGKLLVAIFNRDEGSETGGNFRWIVKDKNIRAKCLPETWNVVLLDTEDGGRGEKPLKEKLEEIGASKLRPVIILDAEERIRAVIYKPRSLGIKAFARPQGALRLELGRRTRERGNIIYSFELKKSKTTELFR